ncbi:MAG TPA: radical SAM family heme chaperone HemW [Candidatus Limnocylindrales bacterium]|nr:radical SAM family heme chaperone HemW [Candidatus Limnocylindrales bacterium]
MSLGIYIQVPFCQTKCTYCNFHTGVVARERYAPYAAAVCREISDGPRLTAEKARLQADTVYFGGGTPSLLEPAALGQIIDALRVRFDLQANSEITLEADPETITPAKAAEWRGAGFSRISLGVQSFNDRELQAAGRMHRRADISAAAGALRGVGLANISMDLIAGLPHQTRATWDESLTALIALRPAHVSVYMLEIDEGSRLGKEALAGGTRYSAAAIPEDDAIADFYETASARFDAAGYEHYEISNWALPGARSRHNLKYWRREPYLGFGAGAHSFDGSTRWANVHDAASYVHCIEGGVSPREQVEPVTNAQALDEEFFLGLRQLEGIDLARIEGVHGQNGQSGRLAALRERLAEMALENLVQLDGTRVRLSPDRLTVSNEVFVRLLD